MITNVPNIPTDLFIPPDALEIILESFTGPLDLLLYLIRRDKLDILDIPMAHITDQYMRYIEKMEAHRVELAADYLVMAAILLEIKSRLLLPVPPTAPDEEEADPRLTLVKRLQIYEYFKHAAYQLDQLPRCSRDVFRVTLNNSHLVIKPSFTPVNKSDLLLAWQRIKNQRSQVQHHVVVREKRVVRDRIAEILERLQVDACFEFKTLLHQDADRIDVVVALLAILELAKQAMLIIVQTGCFTPIYINRVVAHE